MHMGFCNVLIKMLINIKNKVFYKLFQFFLISCQDWKLI